MHIFMDGEQDMAVFQGWCWVLRAVGKVVGKDQEELKEQRAW